MITVNINVKKIEKARLFAGKEGAMYLDLALIESPNDKYGNDYMVVQQITKEERDKGMKGIILGNAKIIGGKPVQGSNDSGPASGTSIDTDSLPF